MNYIHLDTQLLQLMLLGIDHASVDEETSNRMAQLGVSAKASNTDFVLDAFSAISMLKKAGANLQEATNPSAPIFSQTTPIQELSPTASTFFLRIVYDKKMEKILPEFLYLMHQSSWSFAPRLLPIVLNLALKYPQHALIVSLAGQRGQWLAAQKKEWHPLLLTPDPHRWNSANTAQRLAILTYLRATQPLEASKLLSDDWERGSVVVRRKAIEILQIGISPEDADFLDWCGSDKDEKIRQIAAETTSMLPESALVKRMYTRAETWFDALPETISAQDIRDGFGSDNLLLHLATCLPPTYWTNKHLPTDKEAHIGLALSAIRHKDMDFLARVFCDAFQTDDLPNNPILKASMSQIDQDSFQNFLSVTLQTTPATPNIWRYLMTDAHFWSDENAQKTLDWFQQHWVRKAAFTDVLDLLLEQFIYRVTPKFTEQFVQHPIVLERINQKKYNIHSLIVLRYELHKCLTVP